MKTATTVRARLKAIEELPDWVRCCEGIREDLKLDAATIYEVDPNSIYEAKGHCRSCGRVTEHVKLMRVVSTGPAIGTMIPVDCYEFDEGIS